jgi:putative tryptophan/tyrosine transport system substrate-binding protein
LGEKSRRKTVTAKILIWLLATVLLATSSLAQAQEQKKVPRTGLLSPTSDDSRVEAFRQRLRELGYVDGQNITIEYRWADGKFDRLLDLAAELVRLNVDVVVAVVTQASLAAKKSTATIPIVMIGVSDPVGSGLVVSLARPGANITGTSSMTAEVVGKQLELLRETFPKISRVAALWNPANPVFQAIQLRETENAARALGLRLQLMEARIPDEIDRAVAAAARERIRALLILNDPIFFAHRKRLAELSVKHRVAAVSGTLEYTEAGGSHGLRAELSRHVQARRYVCGQDPEGRKAGRSARRAADEVRAGDQLEGSEADWSDDSAERAGKGR